MCPKQTFRIKSLKDPWITNELLEAIKDKDILLSHAKRTDDQLDWILGRRRCYEVKNMIKNAKISF